MELENNEMEPWAAFAMLSTIYLLLYAMGSIRLVDDVRVVKNIRTIILSNLMCLQ